MDMKHLTNIPFKLIARDDDPPRPDNYEIISERLALLYSVATNDAIALFGIEKALRLVNAVIETMVEDQPRPEELIIPTTDRLINLLELIETGIDIEAHL